MLPGARPPLTMRAFRRLFVVAVVALAAVAVAPVAADSGASNLARPATVDGALGTVTSDRTITVDGIEIGVPNPGTGVGASETHPDGSTSDIVVTTDLAGHVSVMRDLSSLTTDEPALASAQGTVAPAVLSACSDPKYNLTGSSWRSTFHWTYKASSTPTNLALDAVEHALKHAVGNITHERNDCGRPDNVSARAIYDGQTNLGTHVGTDASCRRSDGHNVVAFGDLPSSTLGFTCWWFIGSRTIEADTVLNKHDFTFALTTTNCTTAYILEDVATHEFGHVFGLGHVNQDKHANLTMSPQIYACDPSDETLGLGDMQGLERLY